MPKGPQGQKRPADLNSNAASVVGIATGEIREDREKAISGRRKSGIAGARARAEKLTAEERSVIAKKAASARWG